MTTRKRKRVPTIITRSRKRLDTRNKKRNDSQESEYTPLTDQERIVKTVTREIVMSVSHPKLFKQYDIQPTVGLLLHGPPGVGKTTTVNKIAKSCLEKKGVKITVVKVDCSQALSKFVGEGEKFIANVFSGCVNNEYTIVLFDEIDTLTANRGEDGGKNTRGLVTLLIDKIDEIKKNSLRVLVIGTSNHYSKVDPALTRAGRLTPVKYSYFTNEQSISACLHYLSKWVCKKNTLPAATYLVEKCLPKDRVTPALIKAICSRVAMTYIKRTVDDETRSPSDVSKYTGDLGLLCKEIHKQSSHFLPGLRSKETPSKHMLIKYPAAHQLIAKLCSQKIIKSIGEDLCSVSNMKSRRMHIKINNSGENKQCILTAIILRYCVKFTSNVLCQTLGFEAIAMSSLIRDVDYETVVKMKSTGGYVVTVDVIPGDLQVTKTLDWLLIHKSLIFIDCLPVNGSFDIWDIKMSTSIIQISKLISENANIAARMAFNTALTNCSYLSEVKPSPNKNTTDSNRDVALRPTCKVTGKLSERLVLEDRKKTLEKYISDISLSEEYIALSTIVGKLGEENLGKYYDSMDKVYRDIIQNQYQIKKHKTHVLMLKYVERSIINGMKSFYEEFLCKGDFRVIYQVQFKVKMNVVVGMVQNFTNKFIQKFETRIRPKQNLKKKNISYQIFRKDRKLYLYVKDTKSTYKGFNNKPLPLLVKIIQGFIDTSTIKNEADRYSQFCHWVKIAQKKQHCI